MSEEVQAVEIPVESPPPEVVAEQSALTAEVPEQSETSSETEGDKGKDGKKSDNPYIPIITNLRADRRQLAAELEQARQEAKTAKELADRLARGGEQLTTHSAQPPAIDDAEIQRRVDQALYQREANVVDKAGAAKFGRETFNEKVNALSAYVGPESFQQLVAQIMSVDRDSAHVLIHDLALDPHAAIALNNLDPIKRIAELTRMSIARNSDGTFAPKEEVKAAAAQSKQVSRAPAPPPPVQPTSHKVIDFNSPEADKLPDAEWNKLWDERQAKRGRIRL